MAQQKRYKAINFDLSSEHLREVFGGEQGRRKGYSQIQTFLVKEGFEHRQWSGYVSLTPKSNAEMYEIIDRLARHCLWLDACVNKFDVTNVGAESDMRDEIHIVATTVSETLIDEDFDVE